ncbi:MAG: putative Ig domain-containing protein [Candidatus Zixiibacteriota bacterium]
MRLTAVLLSVGLILFSFGTVLGQSITIDHVDGLNASGEIEQGATLTVYMRLTGDANAHYVISNGFRVYGNDLNWGSLSGKLNPAYKWDLSFGFPCFFDLGMYINVFSTGSVADTIGFGGAAGMFGTGLPAGFDDIGYWINLGPVTGGGDFLYIDSSFYPPAGRWVWDIVGENVAWGGPYAFPMAIECEPAVFTSTPITEGEVGTEYVYDVNATGNPAPEFSLTVFPEGMAIDPMTGVITFTPTAAGDYAVTVVASNACSAPTQEFVIHVPEPPVAPVITSTPIPNGVVNSVYTYDVNATGNPVPTYALTVFPDGMVIVAETGAITWTPTATGDYDVTVVASNGVVPDAVQSFVITVTPELVSPTIVTTPVTDGQVGEAYYYDVDATGYPEPTFTLTTAPGGMTIDGFTGEINWTPTAAGDFSVTVRAANGVSPAATQSFVIAVVPAFAAPVITSTPVLEGAEGDPYYYDVNATGYPAATFTLTVFPDGMTINEATGEINWTPTVLGDYDVTVVAANGIEPDAVQSFVISVAEGCPVVITYLEQDPIILKDLADRVLRVYVECEDNAHVDLNTVVVQGKIPPYTAARIEGDLLVTDVFIFRFLAAWRPIAADIQSQYTVAYNMLDGTFVELSGEMNLQVYPGDLNFDGIEDVNDITFLVDYMFRGGDEPMLPEALDVNRDGYNDIRDLRAIVEIVY